MESSKIIVYTDGGSRGNPGPAGVGVFVVGEKGQILSKYSKFLGTRTNNEAEYDAVIFALQKSKARFGKEKIKEISTEFRMDSQLVVRQLSGKYKIEAPALFPLFIKIWNLKMEFGPISFVEIPREQNEEADKLANEAMDGEKSNAA